MMRRAIVMPAVVAVVSSGAVRGGAAAVVRVAPGEAIQEAIGRASFGDTVRVPPGNYFGNVRLPGGVTLEGEGGWPKTRIVGSGEGPVVFCEGSGDRTLSGFTVSGGPPGVAAVKAVLLQEGFLVVRDCRITENRGDGIGATLYAAMTAFTAENNIVDGNEGRGIAVEVAFSRARLDGNRVLDNRNGGVWVAASDEGEFTAARNEVAENLAAEGGGFAGEVSGGATARLVANRIAYNRANRAAGVGLRVTGATLDLWTNDIHDNLAFEALGAVRIVAEEGSAVALVNNTVAGNTAPIGGGVTIDPAPGVVPRVVNCVLWGNSAPDLTGATATHSIIGTGATEGAGNMSTAPRFFDAENGDYRLCPRSPGVDDGESESLPEFLAIDAEGGERRYGPAVDCGAYETVPTADRLDRLRMHIDSLAVRRRLSHRLSATLQARLSLARTSLRARHRWRVRGAVGYLKAMGSDLRREIGRGATTEAADALIPALATAARQVEVCGG